MKNRSSFFRRAVYGAAALLLLSATVLSSTWSSRAYAAQLSSRSIKLSDSGPSGGTITSGVGSGANVTYQESFTTSLTASSLVIDFCGNSPIIGQSCTAPTGMNASGAALTGVSGNIGTGWTVTASAAQVKLAIGTGTAAAAGAQVFNLTGIVNPSALGSFYARIYTYSNATYGTYGGANIILPPSTAPTAAVTTGTTLGIGTYQYEVTYVEGNGETTPGPAVTVTTTSGNQAVNLSAIPTGPAGVTARKIYRTAVGGAAGSEKLLTTIADNTTTTYADTTADSSLGAAVPTTNTTGPGNYEDYGGIALTTVQVITITARVQETLTFCVSGSNTTNWTTTHTCTDPSAAVSPALILGHGSPTAILDSSAVDYGTDYSQLSTNATSGAVINMRNSNTGCGGLSDDGGTTCAIPAIGTPAANMVAGTADFGLFVAASTTDVNGTGTLTPATTYNNGTNTTVPSNVYYGMNAANVGSTFGDTIASTTAPCYRVDQNYTFAATAALTTPAGIYTANMAIIATGTF